MEKLDKTVILKSIDDYIKNQKLKLTIIGLKCKLYYELLYIDDKELSSSEVNILDVLACDNDIQIILSNAIKKTK